MRTSTFFRRTEPAAWETIRDVYGLELDAEYGVPAMIGTAQTFGDLVHWHSHIHAIVAEGVFTESGHFVHMPDTWKYKAVDIWQDVAVGPTNARARD